MVLGFNSWVQLNENDNLEAASVAKKVYIMLKSAGNEVDLTYQTEALGRKGVANHIRNSAPGTVSVSYYVNWVHVVPVDSDTADSLIRKFETSTLTAKKSRYNDELYTVAFSIKDRKQRQDFKVSDYSYQDKKNKNDRKREQNAEMADGLAENLLSRSTGMQADDMQDTESAGMLQAMLDWYTGTPDPEPDAVARLKAQLRELKGRIAARKRGSMRS